MARVHSGTTVRSSMKIWIHTNTHHHRIIVVIILSFSIFIFFSSFVWNFCSVDVYKYESPSIFCGWMKCDCVLWLWHIAHTTQAHRHTTVIFVRRFAFTIYFWCALAIYSICSLLSCSPYTIPLNKYIFSFRLAVVARGDCIRSGCMRVAGHRDYFYQREVNSLFIVLISSQYTE